MQPARVPLPSSAVTDDKKQTNERPGSIPDLSGSDEENPWDDDGGGRTLATEMPAFELPSNIPSPITVPPPPNLHPATAPAFPPATPNAFPPKRKPQATMIGFGPPGPALPPEKAEKAEKPEKVDVTPAPPAAQAKSVFDAKSKPMPASPLGGATVQAFPPPPSPSSPDLAAAAASPPSSVKRGPASAPRPASASAFASAQTSATGGPSAPRPGALGMPSARAPLPLPSSARAPAGGVAVTKDGGTLADSDAPVPAAVPVPAPSSANDLQRASGAQQEDGPTMAVASPVKPAPLGARPPRDDVANPRPGAPSPLASTGYQPPGRSVADKDADTAARRGSSPVLPSLNDNEGESDEATRAVPRDELVRRQDAHVVVGEDAMGDEATLAVPPGHIDGLDPEIAAALIETLKDREGSQPRLQSAPSFPNPPQHFQQHNPMSSGHLPSAPPFAQTPQPLGMGMQHVAPSWGEAAHSHREPPQHGMYPGFDPLLPQQAPQGGQGYMHGQFPQSGQQGPGGGYSPMGQPMGPMGPMGMQGGGPGGYAQPPNAPGGGQPLYEMQRMQPMQPMQGQQQGWMAPPAPPAGTKGPTKLTPQIILLAAVGVVCLAIFVIGIVLFVTTKF